MIKVNNIPTGLSKLKKLSINITADCFYEQMSKRKIFSLTEDMLLNGIDFEDLVENMKDELRILIFQTDSYFDIVRGRYDHCHNGYILEGRLLKVV